MTIKKRNYWLIKKLKMKTFKLCSVVLLMFALSISYGQTYNEIVTQAYSCAYIENDYQEATKLFEKAFNKSQAKSSDLYYAAEISLKMDSVIKFKQFLTDAVNSGYSNYQFLEKQKMFKTQFDISRWEALILKSKDNYSIFEKDYAKLKKSLTNHYQTTKIISGIVDLRHDTLNVKYQGKRNTCSVFAATALVEYIVWGEQHKKIDLSEAYNYWAAKKYALNNTYLKEIYTSIDGLAGYLAVEAFQYGVMDEVNWKYENTNWLTNKDKRCKKTNGSYNMECFTGIPPKGSKKLKYTAQAIFIDREDIGQYILQEKKPVAMNIFWYFDAIDNKTGVFRMPTEKDINKGGHVILLVGYNSETKTFIFQNSWGTRWGNKGFGIIPEDYILNYYEMAETFPYGIDASEHEKNMAIKASMGVSAKIDKEIN